MSHNERCFSPPQPKSNSCFIKDPSNHTRLLIRNVLIFTGLAAVMSVIAGVKVFSVMNNDSKMIYSKWTGDDLNSRLEAAINSSNNETNSVETVQSVKGTNVSTKLGKYHNPFTPLHKYDSPCMGGAYTSGYWELNVSKRPLYPSMGKILGCCQLALEKRIDRIKRHISSVSSASNGIPQSPQTQLPSSIRPETQYVWRTDKCTLLPWSEELFCKSLRGRSIMLAGDSLNDHWHASLYYLLGGRKDIYKSEGTTRGMSRCPAHDICSKYTDDKKPLKLFFLTNQFLEEESRHNRNYRWWKYINKYEILILNSGSWMHDPRDESIEVSDKEYSKRMREAVGLVKRHKFKGTLIWRTTYQGHPFCWNYSKPLTKELENSDFQVKPYTYYRWDAIPKRNQFATKLWRDAGAHILDVTRITNLMPLGHLGQNHPNFESTNTTDCLHYCSPGAVYDTWSMLLMNLLAGNLVD